MPELFLADALGAAGKPLLRVHTAGSVGGSTGDRRRAARAGRASTSGCSPWRSRSSPSPTPCGRCRSRSRSAAGARRRRRLLRAAHPLLHPPLGRARPHRRDGRRQGPAERAEEPVRPPARARHHLRVGPGLADAVGPDPLRRDLPVLRRRLRAWCSATRTRAAAVDRTRPGSTAPRCAPSRPCPPAATRSTRRPAATARPTLYKQAGITDPRERDRLRRDLRAVLVVRADVAGEPRLRRARATAGSSPRTARPRSTATCRSTCPAACCRSNPIGASGHAPLRRGGACRCAGQAGEHQVDGARTRARARLRRRLAVLRHVGRRRGASPPADLREHLRIGQAQLIRSNLTVSTVCTAAELVQTRRSRRRRGGALGHRVV